MTRNVILCGGVRPPRGRRDAIALNLSGTDRNVRLQISALSEAMVASVPNRLHDLVEVAAYVYAADQAVGRGSLKDLGERWSRDFEFHIPVRDADWWSSPAVLGALVKVLASLSDDHFTFRFTPIRPGTTQQESYFETAGTSDGIDEVILFSGGLDSLAGALTELDEGRRVALVSHRSAPTRSRVIGDLAQALTERCQTRRRGSVFHVPVWVNKDEALSIEATQRTRSFLFASLGTTVARMFGRSRVRFYENGVTSLNLPISGQVVGARATRSTHPHALELMSQFLSTLLETDFSVENPFLWKTKQDVVTTIVDHGERALVKQSVSCSEVRFATRAHTHCGRCSQCVDRRFATIAAGLGEDDPPEMYGIDLLTGVRERGPERTLAESYTRRATEIGRATDAEFFVKFPESMRGAGHVGLPVDQACERILDLHRRHAQYVTEVLDRGIGEHATELREGTLPASCLLVLSLGYRDRVSPSGDAPSAETSDRGEPVAPSVPAADGTVVDVRARTLTHLGEEFVFTAAPQRFDDLCRLAEARLNSRRDGWTRLRPSNRNQEKKARELLRQALNHRREGLADELLEAASQLGIRFRTRPRVV